MEISILLIVFIVVLVLELIIKFKSFKKDEERKNAIAEKELEELQARIEKLQAIKEFHESMTFTAVNEDD